MPRNYRMRRSLHLSIDSSPFDHYNKVNAYNATPDSSSPGSAGSLSTSSTSTASSAVGSDWKICSALCLYDYSSDDPSHLSFAKNEILEIVQQEPSGWWAALRPQGNHIGWISSAFVEPLSDEIGEKLKRVPEHLRVLEYDAGGRLSTPISTRVTEFVDPMSPLVEALENHGNWGPNITKTPAVPEHEQFAQDVPHEILSNLVSSPAMTQVPSDAPLTYSELDSWSLGDSVKGRQNSSATLLPQPIPRTVFGSSDKPVSPRPSSVPLNNLESPVVESHSRSRSESIPHRHLRRRPLLLDDSSSLSRLSTLIESHNTAEIDVLANSPMESMDAFSRLALKSPGLRSGGTRMLVFPRDPQLQSNEAVQATTSPKLASPRHLRSSYGDDDIILGRDGTVKAATLSALVERLTLDHLKFTQETKFRHTFLATFRTFSSADLVFDLLINRYRMEPPHNLTPEECEEWKEKKLRPTQHRVLTVLTMWLEDHNMMRDDRRTVIRLREFLSAISEPQSLALTANLMLQAVERLTFLTPQSSTSTLSPTPRRKYRKGVATELVRMDVVEVAQQLCLLEHRLYAKIRVRDCWRWRREPNALTEFCSTHDKLATWVTSSVLNVDGVRKKADVVDFWISCANSCRAMNNISSMNAIITALTSDSISPFDPTWDHINRRASLDALATQSDPANDFATYKAVLQTVDGPCVPFVGMYLMEINRVHDRYLDTVRSSNRDHTLTPLINFSKRQKWLEIVKQILRFQSRAYTYAEAPQTMGFIEGHLILHDSDASRTKNRGQEVPDTTWLHTQGTR